MLYAYCFPPLSFDTHTDSPLVAEGLEPEHIVLELIWNIAAEDAWHQNAKCHLDGTNNMQMLEGTRLDLLILRAPMPGVLTFVFEVLKRGQFETQACMSRMVLASTLRILAAENDVARIKRLVEATSHDKSIMELTIRSALDDSIAEGSVNSVLGLMLQAEEGLGFDLAHYVVRLAFERNDRQLASDLFRQFPMFNPKQFSLADSAIQVLPLVIQSSAFEACDALV